ncbi:hypothetical protein R6Q59_007460 [Mikania micrantha]
MIDIWNTPEWKAKSQRNTDIKSKSIGGKHTLETQSYMTAKKSGKNILGRERQPHEMWKQSHCRKGSRPLDKDLSSSSSHVSDVDSEENIEEDNLVWVDERAKETWVKYDEYLVDKYGDERSNHPKFNEVLWSRAAGGKNKRKVYGLSCVNDSNAHGRQNHEVATMYGFGGKMVVTMFVKIYGSKMVVNKPSKMVAKWTGSGAKDSSHMQQTKPKDDDKNGEPIMLDVQERKVNRVRQYENFYIKSCDMNMEKK